MGYLETYELWTTDPYFDEDTRNELKSIVDEKEIKDRFYKDLEFGTGGLRGVIGAGTNRMNRYTVRKATQGLANFILEEKGEQKGVAIAYDSRRMSPEFAMETALCFCANGIRTYLFEGLRPTPELSYAVRKLGCMAGVVITASHNPAEYNGYKVYWEDGAQITHPMDAQIIERVNRIKNYRDVKSVSEREANKKGLLQMVGKELDQSYLEEVKKLSLRPDSVKAMRDKVRIVYSPLHGTGNIPVRTVLRDMGWERVFIVPEQERPDGRFPTVPYPNPEDERAFELALQHARKEKADLVMATDPDADRLGVYVRDLTDGDYKAFTGNMSGVLLCDYVLSQRRELGKLPQNGAVVTTIVTSDMVKAVADDYKVKCIETLTGFKYIGEQIKFFERNHSHEFLFGMEESYGCLTGTYARDKDAVSAVAMLCEAAAYYKERGKTLWDRMLSLYEKYGYYKEDLKTVTLKGEGGSRKIRETMENIRKNPPEAFGDWLVEEFRDYETGESVNLRNGEISRLNLPVSNVLYFDLSDHAWCCVRPSGTEPKIKFYMGIRGRGLEDADRKLNALVKAVLDVVNRRGENE